MTPSGIEPATFRFVAQHLNHCDTAVPGQHMMMTLFLFFFFPAMVTKCVVITISFRKVRQLADTQPSSFKVLSGFLWRRNDDPFEQWYSWAPWSPAPWESNHVDRLWHKLWTLTNHNRLMNFLTFVLIIYKLLSAENHFFFFNLKYSFSRPLDSAAWAGPTTRHLPPRYAPAFNYFISKFNL